MSASPKPSGGAPTPEERLLEAIAGTKRAVDELLTYPRPGSPGGPNGPSGPSLSLHERAKLIHNEKVKMTAGTLNSVALALLGGGPIATLLGTFSFKDWPATVLFCVVWVVAGFVLHLLAKAHLEALQ